MPTNSFERKNQTLRSFENGEGAATRKVKTASKGAVIGFGPIRVAGYIPIRLTRTWLRSSRAGACLLAPQIPKGV
jgi:hypothetical protein